MGENDLSGRVGMDTTDFKTAIAGMNREIRVIESGFRASAAALGDWGKSADGLETRIQALSSEMDVQQRKVSALASEYERVAASQGEGSRAAQDLQIRLNRETETLNKMGAELGQTKTALTQMGDSSSETAGNVDELDRSQEGATGSAGKLQGALDALHGKLQAVGGGIKDLGDKVLNVGKNIAIGLAAGVAGAAVGIGALIVKTAQSADEMVELADKTGLTVTQIQELSYIGEQTGTSLDTVTGSMAKLVRSMASAQGGTGAAADAFAKLGVSTTDANGNLLDSQAVFGNVLNALSGVGNETERDALAMALFGKSAQELNPLIDLGAEGMAAMAAEAQSMGAIMSEDAVNAAADLNDKLGSLKAGVAGLGGKLAGALAPSITKVVNKFQEWMQSPAVQDGIKALSEKIGKIADTIGEVVMKLMSGDLAGALGEIFPPATVEQIMAVADAVRSFIDDTLIPFVTTHAEEIKGAFIAIGAVLAGAGIVSLLMSIANPIGLIIAAVGLLGAAWAGNWGGIRDKLMAVWTVVQPKLQELWNWLEVVIPPAIQKLSDFWNNTLLPALNAVWEFIKANIIPILQDVWTWLETNIPPAIQKLSDFWKNTLLPALEKVWSYIQDNILPIFTTLKDFFINTFLPKAKEVATFIGETLKNAFDKLKSSVQWVIDKVTALWNKLKDLVLPDWLTPGSPTPFELGLRGIARAMDDLNRKQLPEFSGGLGGLGEGGRAGTPFAGGITRVYNLTINSAARAESLPLDFRMMEALARA